MMSMTGYLNDRKIDYVLFHLNHSCTLNEEVRNFMEFRKGKDDRKVNQRSAIIFQLSNEGLDDSNILTIQGIPVLFPVLENDQYYSIEKNSLVFHHDLLKSVFYLLSGYQELHTVQKDPMGRFPYNSSIQYKIEMARKPLVNYYFQIIAQGIGEFCQKHSIPFQKRSIFKNFAAFLTHDVDHVDTYTIYEAIFKIKQFLGLSPSEVSRSRSFRIACRYLLQWINPFNKKNLHWDFPSLRAIEEENNFKSAFYFLPKDQRHVDAYYTFNEPRIKELINTLGEEGCEIGLHGTVRSHTSEKALQAELKLLGNYTGQKIQGIRQHRLMYDMNITPSLHQRLQMYYDTTLGFAEHEGFRNSYCLPFRMYDHVSDQMMSLWEIPLAVMDATLFYYQKYSLEEARKSIMELVDEIIKFNGVFVLLWHNGQNDEFLRPGISAFYIDLIKSIAEKDPERMLGYQIIDRMKIQQNTKHV